ncbi:NAD-dependent succinate-semialdehyde dehydrogenase [Vibrio sp. Vb339]|uniref:NAD-dependent succinate-semialdehyde dehydrogenase n=1 Tax=Vibrio sp. Vb339 TaxID=1192013 RepID=UPI001554A11A|nr:NAD-dependent succinate-semialdehyde dehydrogenase [Vibrio sp. Vb339]
MNLLDNSLLKSQCYIGGKWVDGEETISVTNPATMEVVGSVPKLGEKETRLAIEYADDIVPKLRAMTSHQRADLLHKWVSLIHEHKMDLAVIMTTEQGKPFSESIGEIDYAASYLTWFAEEGKRSYGRQIPTPVANQRLLVTKEPIGVCAAITPWNFPAAMITRKVGAAFAAGCPLVLKPASETPLTALALADLAQKAGIPEGAFSVVTGVSSKIGAEMTSNPIVKKLSFTGSTSVGVILMADCSSTMKKLSLELGGSAPFVVFEDADITQAVAGAMTSKFRNGGQTCVCANRFYVHESVFESFVEQLVQSMRHIKVGNGLDSSVTQGPLIDIKSANKVKALVDDAVDKGALVVIGGQQTQTDSCFFEPTLLVNIDDSMDIAHEEIFGPVVAVMSFRSDEEALSLSNNSEYGLAAYFYTKNHARALNFAEKLSAGMVGINTGMISNAVAPFGGVKQSGIGREGGREGLEEYQNIKYICSSF